MAFNDLERARVSYTLLLSSNFHKNHIFQPIFLRDISVCWEWRDLSKQHSYTLVLCCPLCLKAVQSLISPLEQLVVHLILNSLGYKMGRSGKKYTKKRKGFPGTQYQNIKKRKIEEEEVAQEPETVSKKKIRSQSPVSAATNYSPTCSNPCQPLDGFYMISGAALADALKEAHICPGGKNSINQLCKCMIIELQDYKYRYLNTWKDLISSMTMAM